MTWNHKVLNIYLLKLKNLGLSLLLLRHSMGPKLANRIVYTSRSTHRENRLINKYYLRRYKHIILGDFNCNVISQSNSNNNNEALLNIADIYNLKQLIEEQTRITCNSSTLIDLIFTNYPEHIVCSVVSHISIVDHSLPVYAYRKLSTV